ncbi:MAG: hypothetical protein HY744_21290 [Deltaproteobacteria bacterium]|nr:hypothetical protein [Deltaproteobacteria bacterium]
MGHASVPRLLGPCLLVPGLLCAAAPSPAQPTAEAPVRLRAGSLPRPLAPAPPWCSLDEAVCVHALAEVRPKDPGRPHPRHRGRGTRPGAAPSASMTPGALRRALLAAEAALRAYRLLDLPPPLPDAGLGGSPAYDVYLDPAATAALTHADPVLERDDRASAFGVAPVPRAAGGICGFELDVARLVAEAILAGLDAALHPAVRAMHASYLASLVAPCTPVEAEAIDRAQRAPELGLAAQEAGFAGTLLFPAYLDYAYGRGAPGALMTALVAASGQRTPPEAAALRDEPDVFDSLRVAARDRERTLDDILLEFAVARAFVGDRADGAHLPPTERYGSFGRVRFEWSVPFSTLPRRLAPAQPVYATGASYLWLDLDGAPADAQLRLLIEWEESFVLHAAIVKVDRRGREVGRILLPGVYGSTEEARTVADLADLAGLLLVVANMGADSRSQPFDPDDGPGMPASYLVTLAPI